MTNQTKNPPAINVNDFPILAKEQEAITRKQLQMLQADEQAESAKISALEKRQEQRAELLRNHQCALEIEKERARKEASLPPPLPKSVKLLLKQTEEPTASEPDVLMPEELNATTIKPTNMPCPLSDKILFSAKQSDMEDAEEKVFKKRDIKKHDIEDQYESKYDAQRRISAGDVFNDAYIETPPDADKFDDLQFKTIPPCATPPNSPVFDYRNAGVMAFKKRTHVPLGKFQRTTVPRMHKGVLYDPPSARQSEYSAQSPLSSSSYCSLPSKHGMQRFPSDSPESVKCDICIKKDAQNNLSEFQSKVTKFSPRYLPRFTLNYDTKPEDGMVLKPHIYHELSTIQELDSALVGNSLQVSQRNLSGERAERKISSSEKSDGDQSAKGLKVASLLDSPTSQVADLIKSIYFVSETEENKDHRSCQ